MSGAAARLIRASPVALGLLVNVPTARPQSAPPPIVAPYRNRVVGVYDVDAGAPVEGARVIDVLSGTTALTTSTGTASLAFLPDGGSIVRVAKLGYETQTFLVTISPKDTSPITVTLMRSAGTTLPAVVATEAGTHYVSPALQGFEARRAQGFGHFITEAELRKSDGRFLPNVLEAIPGLRMVVYKAGTYVASSRDQKDSRVPSFQQYSVKPTSTNPDPVLAQGCWVSLYIDGIRTYDPTANQNNNPPDFSQMDVHQFAGIEYYSGSATVPAQFNGSGNTCGTLLLWTREQ